MAHPSGGGSRRGAAGDTRRGGRNGQGAGNPGALVGRGGARRLAARPSFGRAAPHPVSLTGGGHDLGRKGGGAYLGVVGRSDRRVVARARRGTVGGHVRRSLGWSEEPAATGYAGRGDASAGDAGAGGVCAPWQGPHSFIQFFAFAQLSPRRP